MPIFSAFNIPLNHSLSVPTAREKRDLVVLNFLNDETTLMLEKFHAAQMFVFPQLPQSKERSLELKFIPNSLIANDVVCKF